MRIITETVRTDDTVPYSVPEITIKGETGNEYVHIFINKLPDQMTRLTMNLLLTWFATIFTILNGLGVDQETREKILEKIGSKIYEAECNMTGGNIPISQMTLGNARNYKYWIERVYSHTLSRHGLPDELIDYIILEPLEEIEKEHRL